MHGVHFMFYFYAYILDLSSSFWQKYQNGMKLQWSIVLSLMWTIDFKLSQPHTKSRITDFEALDFPMGCVRLRWEIISVLESF